MSIDRDQLSTDLDFRTLGEQFYLQTLDQLSAANIDEPSLLPDWSRKHVAVHMIANAEALMRLLDWAETGGRNPMYSSREARDAEIADGVAHTASGDIREISHEVAGEFAEAAAGLPAEAWSAGVENCHGKPIVASDIPWMRARECFLHALDLNIGATARDFPAAVVDRLLGDIIGDWEKRGEGVDYLLRLTDRPDRAEIRIRAGASAAEDDEHTSGEPLEITGEAAEIVSYLYGRGWPSSTAEDAEKGAAGTRPDDLPAPPRWR